MGLNRVSNPRQLRKLSARVGLPVIRGYARYFQNQNTILAFTDRFTAWVVPKDGPVERYTDEKLELILDADGGGTLRHHPQAAQLIGVTPVGLLGDTDGNQDPT